MRLLQGVGRSGRVAWVVADQAVSSATNFVVSLAALRLLDVEGFGAFSLAILTYQLIMRATRALVSQPLMARYSTTSEADCRHAGARALGAIALVGVVATAVLAVPALFLSGPTPAALLVLAPFMPGLLVQDGWRHLFLTMNVPRRAFVNDLVWALGMAMLLGLAWIADLRTLSWILGGWAAAATIAAVAGVWQGGLVPRPSQARAWFREHGRLGIRLAGEILIARGVHQLTLFLLAALVGLAALGGVNGARVLLGPINVLYLGVASFGVTEGARWYAASPVRFRRRLAWLAAALAALPVVAAGLLWTIPQRWLDLLTGGSWDDVVPFLLPVTVVVAAQGWMNATRIGLSVLEDGTRSLKGQLAGSPAILAGTGVGALLGGIGGAASGMAVGFVVAAVVYHLAFRHACSAAYRRDRPAADVVVPR